VAPFSGRKERLERYFAALGDLVRAAVEETAAACFEEVILDLTDLPREPQRAVQLLTGVDGEATRLGLRLRLVGPADVAALLQSFADTAQMPLFPTVAEAQAA
jgi:hypothetical protein